MKKHCIHEFKWKQGLGIKLLKGSADHHEDHKLSFFKNKNSKKLGTSHNHHLNKTVQYLDFRLIFN